MRTWPNIKERRPTIQREFKGVNKLDSFSISDIFATDESNLSSALYPALSVRPGFSVSTQVQGATVLGMSAWKDTEAHAIFSDGTWRKQNAFGVWTILKSGLSTTAIPSWTNFKGGLPQISLFMANGVDGLMYYDGNTVTNVSGPSGPPNGLNFIESHVDRLWGAAGNTFYASEYRVATNWSSINQDDADPFYAEAETPNGETIIGVIASGSSLIVVKRNSIHKLMGYSAADFTLRRVSREVGMLNNQSAAIIRDVLYLLDERGIYDYYGSTSPENGLSRPVQDYIDRMNKAARNASCIGTDGSKLYAAIPMTGSTPDTILVYDTDEKTWDVWNLPATCFARMGDDLYIGDAQGRVLKLGGTADNGTAISWYRVSVPYTAASLAQKVRLNSMWFTVDLPAGSTLKIYLSAKEKGEDWVEVKSITPTTSMKSVPIYVPTNVIANANVYRVKLAGTGPCTIREFARDQMEMPIV